MPMNYKGEKPSNFRRTKMAMPKNKALVTGH